MKEKVKSLVASIGYLLLAGVIQFIVSFIAGIIIGMVYVIKNGGNDMGLMMDYVNGSVIYILLAS